MGTGPVRKHLTTFDLHVTVIGASGEVSPDFEKLVKEITRKGSTNTYQEIGTKTADAAYPHIKSRITKVLGIAIVRSHAELLHRRISAILARAEDDLPVQYPYQQTVAAQQLCTELANDFISATTLVGNPAAFDVT